MRSENRSSASTPHPHAVESPKTTIRRFPAFSLA